MSTTDSVSDMETTPPSRVTRNSPAKITRQWSKNEKKQLNDMIVWCDDLKAYYLKQLELGPSSKEEPPKKPENNLRCSTVNTGEKTKAKTQVRKGARKQLSGEDLNTYLKQFYLPNYSTSDTVTCETLGRNLSEVATRLKHAYLSTEYKSLESFFLLGNLLKSAKMKFDELKIVEKIEITWQEWIVENTGMSPAYCRRLKRLFDLLTQYPKLQYLKGISCTEICKLHSSIETTFRNPAIAIQWL